MFNFKLILIEKNVFYVVFYRIFLNKLNLKKNVVPVN